MNVRPADLSPFVGCWESEDGLSREGWTVDPSGWLVGYVLDRDAAGTVKFFEHMRIEVGQETDKAETFVVNHWKADAPVHFTRETTEDSNVYRFVNADNDFPQVIIYKPTPERLDAEIMQLDGSNVVKFEKAACKP